MMFFTCLLDPGGKGILGTTRRDYERLARSIGLPFQWRSIGQMSVLVAGAETKGIPLVTANDNCSAVGVVRLDNRAKVAEWSGCDDSGSSDLELVLHVVGRHGPKYVAQFGGDFAFVVWNAATQTAVVAVDIFALKKLYYTQRGGIVALSSRAEALAVDERYEVQYLAELVAGCSPTPTLTVYSEVQAIPAATVGVLECGRLFLTEYWTPYAFEPNIRWIAAKHEAAGTCRQLLAESLKLRLGGYRETWAQLSGGIDSSAVVALTQWLYETGAIPYGLAGTVTYTDREGTEADEREYSNLVASHWRLGNETIVNPRFWFDPRYPLPRSDLPGFTLPFYSREQELCRIVRESGGHVLLTGIGGDELFTGVMLFFADWIARGRALPAIREMARRATIGRVSFWELAYRNALLPLLPSALRNALLEGRAPTPSWLCKTVIRKYQLRAHGIVASEYAGRLGHKYQDAVAKNIAAIGSDFEYGTIGDALDVRHPFLYRPLVEFALQLPPELCAQPHARKWLLREAMRGILPEAVRTRIGKGGPAELYAWSLAAQRPLLDALVREPILADLGIVDPVQLRDAFDNLPHEPRREDERHASLHMTLVIEAWLQMRVGRWPRGATSEVNN